MIFAQADQVSLCSIPLEVIHQFVGRSGDEACQYVETFWRSTRMISMIDIADPFSFADPMSAEISLFAIPTRLDIDLRKCGRVRTFNSGTAQAIFSQSCSRNFLYFIVSGESALLRGFSDVIVPEEVDLGQRYLSGDFIVSIYRYL